MFSLSWSCLYSSFTQGDFSFHLLTSTQALHYTITGGCFIPFYYCSGLLKIIISGQFTVRIQMFEELYTFVQLGKYSVFTKITKTVKLVLHMHMLMGRFALCRILSISTLYLTIALLCITLFSEPLIQIKNGNIEQLHQYLFYRRIRVRICLVHIFQFLYLFLREYVATCFPTCSNFCIERISVYVK